MPPGSAGTAGLEPHRIGQPGRDRRPAAPGHGGPGRAARPAGAPDPAWRGARTRRRPATAAAPRRRQGRPPGGRLDEVHEDVGSHPAILPAWATTTGAGSRGEFRSFTAAAAAASSPLYAELAAAVADDDGDPRLPRWTCPGRGAAADAALRRDRLPRTARPRAPTSCTPRLRDDGRPDPRDDAHPVHPDQRAGPVRRAAHGARRHRGPGRPGRGRVRRPASASIPTATATSSTAGRSARAAPST